MHITRWCAIFLPFLNMIVWGECDLSPEELLVKLKQIEHEIGRPLVYERWAPRVIDLDILFIDGVNLNNSKLQIPHPEIGNRPFLQHLLALTNPLKFNYNQSNDCFLKSFTLFPKLVGIVNVTPDSFSDGGVNFKPDKAVRKALELSHDGAAIVELGSQSTRPGADIISTDEEYNRLKPVLDGLREHMLRGDICISIDSFNKDVVNKILNNYPISWINDVSGNLDDDTLKNINSHNCGIILMHSLTMPSDKNIIIKANPIETVKNWILQSIDKLKNLGFTDDKIIIDPGIGFGKSAYQDILLMRNVDEFKNCKLMVGHSRKSFMTTFTKETANNRDIETLAVSALLHDKVDYLRVHNVSSHMRFLVAQQCLKYFMNIFNIE